MNTFLAFLIRVIRKEVWHKWRLVSFIYITTSFVFLVAAWYWPRIYSSSSTVLIDQETILSPLMRGTAVTTQVADRSRIARQLILSNQSIAKVLEADVWRKSDNTDFTPKEFDYLSETIKNKVEVESSGSNLIQISFKDVDPNKAYITTKILTDIFIRESNLGKQAESRSAYEFIDNQVSIYHAKLKNAENAIKEFRSKNIDASPDAKSNVNNRLIELKRELEGVELELSATESLLKSKQAQLAGEGGAENSSSIAKETLLNERIIELERRLDELRLNYKDTYPDIIQLKGQIESLRAQITAEVLKRKSPQQEGVPNIPTGAVAQALRSEILIAENTITTLNSRREQITNLINNEKITLDAINDVEAEIAELTRDYTVNQDMYQNLLEQRENARISMNIDIEKRGSTIKVQEPASLPVTPKGVRFAHIILAGLVISFLIPVGVVYALTILDQKVRSELLVFEQFRLPVLASVYSTETPNERRKNLLKIAIMTSIVIVVWSGYSYAVLLRLQG